MAKRIVILISGRGSNMQSLLAASREGLLGGDVALVVSNRPAAGGLDSAREAGIDTALIDHKLYPERAQFDRELAAVVGSVQPDLVVLAGFMRILTPHFVDAFRDRLVNIHPSLLPLYPGLHTHQRAIDQGDSHGGATVHYVTGELDGGPAIIQARVPIEPNDTADSLAARVLITEHQIYPVAVAWHLNDRLTLDGETVSLDGQALPATGFAWAGSL